MTDDDVEYLVGYKLIYLPEVFIPLTKKEKRMKKWKKIKDYLSDILFVVFLSLSYSILIGMITLIGLYFIIRI